MVIKCGFSVMVMSIFDNVVFIVGVDLGLPRQYQVTVLGEAGNLILTREHLDRGYESDLGGCRTAGWIPPGMASTFPSAVADIEAMYLHMFKT